jgi:hypothetical protein
MSAPARKPLWLPPVSLVAIAFCTWLISFTPKWFSLSHLVPFLITGQAVLLVIIVRAFCYWPPMVRWVGRMPVPHRVVLAVIVAGMIVGHFTLQGRTFFPFVAWEIFPVAREEDPVTCREFIATTASGKNVRLLVEQLFPSIVQFNPPADNDSPAMARLVQTLAQAYNQRHANDPVQRIDLMLLAVKLHPSETESRALPSCELLKHYDISSAPSN